MHAIKCGAEYFVILRGRHSPLVTILWAIIGAYRSDHRRNNHASQSTQS